MKKYIVKYYWPENIHELYAFVCMADDISNAMEQCLNAYDCKVQSITCCDDGSFLEIYSS